MSDQEFMSHSAPFGEAIPAGNPHAVSVSIPTLADTTRLFTDRDADAWETLETIYPRFGEHPYVKLAIESAGIDTSRSVVALSSPEAAERLTGLALAENMLEPEIDVDGDMTFLSYRPANPYAAGVLDLQRMETGWVASSRRAEGYLVDKGVLPEAYAEDVDANADIQVLAEKVQQVYAPAKPDVYLSNSGMSAVNAAIEAVHETRNQDGEDRDIWVILGSIYHDSEELVIGKYPRRKPKPIMDVTDLEKLKTLVDDSGQRIAGVVTEAPTNPLLTVPDLEQTKSIIGDIPLIVDVSTAGSVLVDALPHADVIVESLTKTASGRADIMMGAVIVNPESEYREVVQSSLEKYVESPYVGDVKRLAHEITDWKERTARAGKNVLALAEFFEGHDKIKNVHWTGSQKSQQAYEALARESLIHAGLITVEIKRSMRSTYDSLDLSKGLSFGAEFTLNTPYVQAAHALELADPKRKADLAKIGLTTRIMRVSVGSEDPEMLKAKYAEALSA